MYITMHSSENVNYALWSLHESSKYSIYFSNYIFVPFHLNPSIFVTCVYYLFFALIFASSLNNIVLSFFLSLNSSTYSFYS
jgi:hypothetical protein